MRTVVFLLFLFITAVISHAGALAGFCGDMMFGGYPKQKAKGCPVR